MWVATSSCQILEAVCKKVLSSALCQQSNSSQTGAGDLKDVLKGLGQSDSGIKAFYFYPGAG